jgi:hypothetical protein
MGQILEEVIEVLRLSNAGLGAEFSALPDELNKTIVLLLIEVQEFILFIRINSITNIKLVYN